MVVLCALVRFVGLPSAVPFLVQHGLHSPAWRTREGALRLAIAGLLSWRPSHSAGFGFGAEAGSRRRGNVSGETQTVLSKRIPGTGGRGCGDVAVATAKTAATAAEEILCDVGSLLKDERPEVSANVFDELRLLEPKQRRLYVVHVLPAYQSFTGNLHRTVCAFSTCLGR